MIIKLCGMGLLIVMCCTLYAETVIQKPTGGESILINPLTVFRKGSNNKKGLVKTITCNGPGFKKAVRIESKVKGYPWEYMVIMNVKKGIKKGDTLLVCFMARTEYTANESGQSFINVKIEVPNLWKLPYKEKEVLKPLTQGILLAAGDTWTPYYIRAQAPRDFNKDEFFLVFRAGMERQKVILGNVDIINYGNSIDINDLPQTQYSYVGREPDAVWRKEADARIERIRKRDLIITIKNKEGIPLKNTNIHIELMRHSFGFGGAVVAHRILKEYNPDYMTYRAHILENFSSLSFINALKWHPWVRDWGERMLPNVTIKALKWVQKQGFPFRGHCLVWPRKSSVSNAMRALLESKNPDPKLIQKNILHHIRDIGSKTLFWMDEWDVLNESIPCHDVQDICGNYVMVEWFKEARTVMPNVKLALNEYNILSSLTDIAKITQHEKRIQYLLDNGAPLDVLGMQCHMGANPPSPLRVYHLLERFAKFGLPIRATEFDVQITDPQLQYDYARDFYTILFSHPSVIGIQMWGMKQLYAKEGTRSPLGKAYYELYKKQWNTIITGQTNTDGQFSCRGFLGKYKITIGSKTFFLNLISNKNPYEYTIVL